ncbi:MAG TPA: hypothetical protein VMR34_06040 [Candidatus Saccharimonadales bacterium]|nr:hypothetical protein [Candidatus Saccharimonadales bacterium]
MKENKYLKVIEPSAEGMVFYVLICILVVIGHNVKSIQSYLNLNSNFSLGGHIIHYLDVALTKVLGVSRTNDVGPILFWIIIGLLVYSFAQSTIQLIIELTQDVEERKFVLPPGTNPNFALKDFLRKTVFRLATAVILVFYIFYVVKYFFRTSLYGSWSVISRINHIPSLKWTILILGEIVTLHGVVILMRLFLIRERLFQK